MTPLNDAMAVATGIYGREEEMEASQSQPGCAPKSATSDAQPSALASLLARVEAATGPDRELDARLALYFKAGINERLPYNEAQVAKLAGLCAETVEECEDCGRESIAAWIRVEHYTASLDAALALVERVLPDLYMWRVEFDDEPTEFPYEARIYGSSVEGLTSGRTAPLALLAALLHALAAAAPQGRTETGGGECSGTNPFPNEITEAEA